MTSLFRNKTHLAFWTGTFMVLAVSVGSVVVVYAEEAIPPADVCANVEGDQTAEPCADVQCSLDGGTWSGSACELPPPPIPPTCGESQHLEGDVCVDNVVVAEESAPEPQLELASSTDGTGGLLGGTIATGDATATTSVQNELNINITNPDSEGTSNSSALTNENTNEGDVLSGSETQSSTGENQADGGVSLATVSTGTAVSTASVINVVNTNLFNSEGLVLFLNQLFGGGLDLREYDLSYFFGAPVDCDTNPMILSCRNSSDLNVFNTNMATVTNSVIVRSSTGTNTASSTGDGSALIDTGDAYAAANVLNLVNTNLINSNYLLVSFNNFGNLGGDITLPNADFFKQLLAHGGVLPDMNSSSVITHSANDADFTGTTTANGETGNNIASTTGSGSGEVITGDAYSSADTFNQLNDTQVGGTSVFLLFRVWGDWAGDIQGLPEGMSWMETPAGIVLMSDGPQCSNNQDDDGDGFADSADSTCHTNGNENNEFTYDPYGTSENAPQCSNGIDDDSDGFVDVADPSCFTQDHGEMIYQGNMREQSPNGEYNSSNLVASSTNVANVENDVQVYALTGENQTVTENGTSTIATGNAYAAANVVNLVNTNIIGRNWIFAIFNIFGNWDGNIAFGRPDLWIGAIAETTNPTLPGSDVTYRFTVANHGDADADNILLSTEFDTAMLTFETPGDVSAAADSSGEIWNLGGIPRGETRDFTYTARVRDLPDGTSVTVPLRATVTSSSADNNNADNSEAVTIVVASPEPAPEPEPSPGTGGNGGGGGGGGGGGSPAAFGSGNNTDSWSPDPNISVTKTATMGTSTTVARVDYEVVVFNDKNAGPAYRGLLTDTLYDPLGEVMYNRTWNLDTIVAGDLITLTYSVEYGASTTPGIYRNVAKVTGKRNYSNPALAVDMTPVEGSASVEFDELTLGRVLGMATSTTAIATSTITIATSTTASISSCDPLISSYLRQGMRNDVVEVKKLQQFLNEDIQAHLPITGFFGSMTNTAVRVFQIKHKNQILTPLGLTVPTGAVYSATKRQINTLACGGVVPLAEENLNRTETTASSAYIQKTSAANPPVVQKIKVPVVDTKPQDANNTGAQNNAKPVGQAKGGLKSWLKTLFLR